VNLSSLLAPLSFFLSLSLSLCVSVCSATVLRPKGTAGSTALIDGAAQGRIRLLKLKLQLNELDRTVERRVDALSNDFALQIAKLEQRIDSIVEENNSKLALAIGERIDSIVRAAVESAMANARASGS
jgi:hypothetical protein